MNRSTFTLIVSVLLFLITITIGYIFSFQYDAEGVEIPTPTPDISTPTPSMTQIIGTIDEVGTQIEYKNATLLRVSGQLVYLTAETRVVDPDNAVVDHKALVARQAVVVEGTPTEGGLDATKITVVSVATLSPSPTRVPTTGTATPAPTAAPAI